MRALETLQEISKKLSRLDIEEPAREAEILLHEGLDLDPLELYRDDPEISSDQSARIEEMIRRRAAREPLQYITGSTGFLDLTIAVGKGVLIPRPETELMAETAIQKLESAEAQRRGSEKRTDSGQRLTILDLCTGSGCLALALAKHFPDSRVYGIDVSEAAIGYAEKNAAANNIANVEFIKGHLFDPLGQKMAFDFIISNPPYIRKDEISELQPEIREWEPLNALDGGEDGLDFYREIIPAAREHLKNSGTLMFEVGHDGADKVADIFREAGYCGIEITKDYSEIKRIVFAKWIK